jgi:hypothetical protein
MHSVAESLENERVRVETSMRRSIAELKTRKVFENDQTKGNLCALRRDPSCRDRRGCLNRSYARKRKYEKRQAFKNGCSSRISSKLRAKAEFDLLRIPLRRGKRRLTLPSGKLQRHF